MEKVSERVLIENLPRYQYVISKAECGPKSLVQRVWDYVLSFFLWLISPFVPTPKTEIKNMVSKIPSVLEFYKNGARNDQGVTLEEIWQKDSDWLEKNHCFIQWLFPLKQKSGPNPTASTTNNQTIAEFKNDPTLQEKMRRSFEVMLAFFGLQKQGDVIIEAPNFNQAAQNWLVNNKHNHLRITRILTSLRVHGLEKDAKAFFAKLQQIYATDLGRNEITADTFSFWKSAS